MRDMNIDEQSRGRSWGLARSGRGLERLRDEAVPEVRQTVGERCAGDALPWPWCGRLGCALSRRDACTTVSDPLDTMLKIIYKSSPVD